MKRDKKRSRSFIWQIIPKNFTNLRKDIDIIIHVAQTTPFKFNKSQVSPKHIMDKFTKYTDKEGNLKAARREKSFLSYMGRQIMFTAKLSTMAEYTQHA